MTVTTDRPLDLDRMRREADELHAAKAAHRQHVEANRIGVKSIGMVTEGMEAWSKYGDDPRGGVIVEITDDVDSETGERLRRFTCLNPFEHVSRWEHHLPETEVSAEDGFKLASSSRLVTIARRLSEEAAKGGSMSTPRDERLTRWSHRLHVIAQGGGR